MRIEFLEADRDALGEGIVWAVGDQSVWWVDIPAGIIRRHVPTSGENRSWNFGEPVGCVALRESGGLVVAAKSGFWFFDPDTGARRPIADPEADKPLNRFNDGAVDRQGRFWAGSMMEDRTPRPAGRFYRLDPDLSVTPWHQGIFTTNGLAFSPDGQSMYFSDSNPLVRMIWRCDYDVQSGRPGEPELFFDTRAVAGRPDGGTVDSDGCYWMAGIGGWQVYRITPDGRVDRTIDVPVERPTKPVFGGGNLDVLYLSSARDGITPGTQERQPEAGRVLAITGLGVTGVPQAGFGG